MKENSKIYIAGHTGLVGSAIWRKLKSKSYYNLIGKTLDELDLKNQNSVSSFFNETKPEYVIIAAAKVGGIVANNTYRADFIYDNLVISSNIIHESFKTEVKKLLFLGSTCIYPRDAVQPIPEDALLTDILEYTNEPYAIAKIAGIKLCESYNLQYGTNFLSIMPTNIYGPFDNFNLETSHVLPALLRKIYLGYCLENGSYSDIKRDLSVRPIDGVTGEFDYKKIITVLEKYGLKINERSDNTQNSSVSIEIWGTGQPMREFLWADDLADASVYIMENVDFVDLVRDMEQIRNTHINIGTGSEISIRDLANLIKRIIGFKGDFIFNKHKPDGTYRKTICVDKIHSLGWRHKVELKEGIELLYKWYLDNQNR